MTALHNFFMYPLGGIPLWAPLSIAFLLMANAAVRAAKWTSAQDAIQLTARFLLKLPAMGAVIASFPLLGEVLHFIADDAERLPPTLTMRARGKMPPKSPPPPSAGATVAMLMLCFFACAHVKSVLIDFGKCEMGQVPDALGNVLSDVNKTLGGESPSWQSDMEALGKKAGMDAVNCAVAAVLHDLAAKHAALDATGRRKSERGQIWLAAHGVAR